MGHTAVESDKVGYTIDAISCCVIVSARGAEEPHVAGDDGRRAGLVVVGEDVGGARRPPWEGEEATEEIAATRSLSKFTQLATSHNSSVFRFLPFPPGTMLTTASVYIT